MRRQTFARSSGFFRLVPFGLFDGFGAGGPLILLAIALMMISAVRPVWFDMPRAAARDALAPALSVLSRPFVALSDAFDAMYALVALKSEAEKLRADNKRLEEWYNAAQLLQAENQSLRDLLNVKLDPSLTFVTARVVGDSGGAYAQTILVAAGSVDGVQKGNTVMAGGGVLGRVIEVSPKTCTVLLMTDVSSRIPVRVEGSHTQAILGTAGGYELTLDRLPDDVTLRPNARILTSGVGGVFPPDLPVGIVAGRVDQKYKVQPYADLSRLVFVRIVRVPTIEKDMIPRLEGSAFVKEKGEGAK